MANRGTLGGEVCVLVAGDDAGTRHAMEVHLRRAGYRTVAATGAADAVETMRDDVGAAVLDLPQPAGLGVLRALKERYPETPVVMVSSQGNVASAVEAMKAGAFHYLAKPLGLGDLVVRVREAVARGANGKPHCFAGKTLAELERLAIIETLRACGGNKAATARSLGVCEKTIYNKLKRIGTH